MPDALRRKRSAGSLTRAECRGAVRICMSKPVWNFGCYFTQNRTCSSRHACKPRTTRVAQRVIERGAELYQAKKFSYAVFHVTQHSG